MTFLLIKTNVFIKCKKKLNWLFNYRVTLVNIHVGWDWRKTNILRDVGTCIENTKCYF